jgi:hypothetical protein
MVLVRLCSAHSSPISQEQVKLVRFVKVALCNASSSLVYYLSFLCDVQRMMEKLVEQGLGGPMSFPQVGQG